MNKISGIYIISDGERFYVGSSCNIRKRLLEHKRKLLAGVHENVFLQRAFIQEKFSFEILEECGPTMLILEEQWYINMYNPDFNLCKRVVSTPLGLKRRPETILKLRASLSGPKHPCFGKPMKPHVRAALIAAVKGKKRPNCGRKKTYSAISPDGSLVSFTGLRKFCREHDISVGNMSAVLSGRLSQTKGWRSRAGRLY